MGAVALVGVAGLAVRSRRGSGDRASDLQPLLSNVNLDHILALGRVLARYPGPVDARARRIVAAHRARLPVEAQVLLDELNAMGVDPVEIVRMDNRYRGEESRTFLLADPTSWIRDGVESLDAAITDARESGVWDPYYQDARTVRKILDLPGSEQRQELLPYRTPRRHRGTIVVANLAAESVVRGVLEILDIASDPQQLNDARDEPNWLTDNVVTYLCDAASLVGVNWTRARRDRAWSNAWDRLVLRDRIAEALART